MNTGNEIYHSKNGLITTIAASDNNEVSYALEGSVFVGGAVMQWLRDGLRMLKVHLSQAIVLIELKILMVSI
ncbi:MAG: hypothetical protein ACLRQF_08455 [Thomasclavelia ramosa]